MPIDSERGVLVGPNKSLTKLQSVVQGTSVAPLPSVGVPVMSPLHQQGHASGEGQEKKFLVAVTCCAVSKKHWLKGLYLWLRVEFNRRNAFSDLTVSP
eukprot:1140639-Pelagomonas_calceolata.AAC.4